LLWLLLLWGDLCGWFGIGKDNDKDTETEIEIDMNVGLPYAVCSGLQTGWLVRVQEWNGR
jgi:hypothetical protein